MEASYIAVIIALVGQVPGILAYIAQRREKKEREAAAKKSNAEAAKYKADAADVLTDTATDLLKTMKAEMIEMADKIDAQEAKIAAQQAKIDKQQERLEKQNERIVKLQRAFSEILLENKMLRSWAKSLTLKLIALGGTPDPEPVIPDENPTNEG